MSFAIHCSPRLRLGAMLLALSGVALHPLAAQAAARTVYDFNPGWKLSVGDAPHASTPEFDDSSWKSVTLPRAWNEDDAFMKDIAQHSTGIAWYRKRFTLPAGVKGKKVFLEFEGVRQGAEIFVNGQQVGLHENGVMAFGIDISDAAVPGTNVIAVRTDNAWDYREKASKQRYQWSDKNFNANYGGIPKNVRLHVADRLYQTLPLYSTLGTTGVYVYAKEFDSFTGKPQTIAAGATTTVSASARVKDLHFWSWGYGYLYDVTTTLKVAGRPADVVQTRTGFRKTEFGNGVIKLNDRVLQMKGYAQRTSNEWPAVGLSAPPWLSDYSNGLMLESNANLVR